MYRPVHFHVSKVRVILKVIALAVLQDEYAVRGQQVTFKDKVRNLSYVLKLIGRVCKNEIKLSVAAGNVFEYVSLYGDALVSLDGLHDLADETVVSGVVLNAYHMRTAS